MAKYIFYAAGIFLLWKVIQIGYSWIRLMQIRLRATEIIQGDRAELSAELSLVFDEAERALTALGFCYSHAESLAKCKETMINFAPAQSHVYYHPGLHTYAVAGPPDRPWGVSSFDVSFITILANGEVITTINGLKDLLPPVPEWFKVYDHYLPGLEQQWEAHLQVLRRLPEDARPTIQLKPEEFLELEHLIYRELISYLLKTGSLSPIDNTHFRFKPLAALKHARQILAGSKKREAVLKVPPKRLEVENRSQVTADIVSFEKMVEAEEKRKWGWVGKSLLFLVSVVVSALSFGMVFSVRTVPILLGTLFFHELGHLFGMIIFGYKDTQIFFVPFLGAATLGKKEDATPVQKLIIYLLGPIPGIIVGVLSIIIYFKSGNGILFEIGVVAIVLNYLNLVPISPFDGGKVVELLLFTRYPRLRFVFMLVSTSILAIVALYFNDKILIFVAALLCFGLPAQWQWGVAASRITKLLPQRADKKECLQAIFQILSQPPFQKQLLLKRFQIAKTLLSHFSSPAPGLKTVLLGGTFYLSVLLLPLFGFLLMSGLKGLTASYLAMNRDPNYKAYLYSINGEYSKAEPLLQNSLTEVEKKFGKDHASVAICLENLALLYKMESNYSKAEPLFKRALSIREKTFGENHPSLIISLDNLALIYEVEERYDEAETLSRHSLEIWKKSLGEDHPSMTISLKKLALLCDSKGNYKEADLFYSRAEEIKRNTLQTANPALVLREAVQTEDKGLIKNSDLAIYFHFQSSSEVEKLCLRSLGAKEKALGPDHVYLAGSLYNLAELYKSEAKYKEAEPLYRRCLAIKERVLGKEHPDLAVILSDLAMIYQYEKRDEDAEVLLKRALEMRERALGKDNPAVAISLYNLAEFYSYKENISEAEALYKRAISIYENRADGKKIDLIRVMSGYSGLLWQKGRKDEANQIFDQIKKIKEKQDGRYIDYEDEGED